MEKVRHYYIETYGCQMNERDSETLAGFLDGMGYLPCDGKDSADLIFFNTCCVRDNAERRVFGNVEWLRERKKNNPHMVIAVCGCMMQQPGVAEKFKKKYSFVDLIFGTNQLHLFPDLMERVYEEKEKIKQSTVLSVDQLEDIHEHLPSRRNSNLSAFVNVMYGCDNFCSYCVVPYVRGRERSRNPDDICEEVRALIASGAKEVTLLGQNVNSYGRNLERPTDFSELLRRISRTGIERIRFMTSHPKDLSDSLIDAMAGEPSVCGHIHLPVQSGSDAVLSAMNRIYTARNYLDLVSKLRGAMPDIGITTDVIVGFPGETESDFEDTLALFKAVRFDSAYTFIYSPREGTPAELMPDQIPDEVKRNRIQRLISLQESVSQEIFASLVSSVQRVLVTGKSRRGEDLTGRGERGLTVNFRGKESQIGNIVEVTVTRAGHNTLYGTAKE